MKIKYLLNISFLLSLLLVTNACKDEEYVVPKGVNKLTNDVIKRNLGPNVVGLQMNFAYAMALPPEKGHIVSAQVEASIPGAAGTFLENNAYHTDLEGGVDVGTEIGEPAVNQGNVSKVTFTKDTAAVTLRYNYVVPAAAKGQEVSFKFSSVSSNGETAEYTMGPYKISNMDMVLDLDVVHNGRCYISIEDMAVYTRLAAAAHPEKIDVIYLYNNEPESNVVFEHALIAPTAAPEYRPDITISEEFQNDTKIQKAWDLRDQQLARLQWGVFIDDVDFQELKLDHAPNYAINVLREAGVWVETADGKYRAYIFMNKTSSGGFATISMKRYQMF